MYLLLDVHNLLLLDTKRFPPRWPEIVTFICLYIAAWFCKPRGELIQFIFYASTDRDSGCNKDFPSLNINSCVVKAEHTCNVEKISFNSETANCTFKTNLGKTSEEHP